MTLQERIAKGEFVLLDGAMGTELERRGVPMDRKAWSAAAMDTHPEVVRDIHEDYIRAGAEIHIVNSFSTARHVLEPAGFGDKVEEFNRRAVELCREAVARAGGERPMWIAGSVSSFAEAADRTKLPPPESLRANFDEQVAVLHRAGVDLFALEMLCDVEISTQAIQAAAATRLPLVIGFTCTLAEDGETVETGGHEMGLQGRVTLDTVLSNVIATIPDPKQTVLAIMHSDFPVTDRALDILARQWTGPMAAYPNSGTFKVPNWQFDTVCSPEEFAKAAERWVARGVQIVGGCCGLGPDHIRAVRSRIRDQVPAGS